MQKREKGTGTIKSMGGKFYARWRQDGKDTYGPARSTRDEAEADRILRKPNSKSATPTQRSMPTLGAFARMCMDQADQTFGWYGRSLKDTTYNTAETIMVLHLETANIAKKVRNIRCKKWSKPNGKMVETISPASPSYKRRCHAFVSKIFAIAIRHKLIQVNPSSGVELPKVVDRLNTQITDQQLEQLYASTSRTGSLMIVAVETGLRRSELINVKWQEISETDLIVTNGKNNDERNSIPLSKVARSAIERQPKNGEFVFCTEKGHPLTPRNLNRDVRTLMEQLGFPKETRLHDLRGKFLSDLIESGVDIKTVQELGRHEDAKTTMKFYLRVTEASKSKAMGKLEEKRRNNFV
jgi:site-specific recombinase XerD